MRATQFAKSVLGELWHGKLGTSIGDFPIYIALLCHNLNQNDQQRLSETKNLVAFVCDRSTPFQKKDVCTQVDIEKGEWCNRQESTENHIIVILLYRKCYNPYIGANFRTKETLHLYTFCQEIQKRPLFPHHITVKCIPQQRRYTSQLPG